jgi:hypothetical protein
MKKLEIYLFLFIQFLTFWGCKTNSVELNIPDNNYNIDVVNLADTSHADFSVEYPPFEYESYFKIGNYEDKYLYKILNDRLLKIHYSTYNKIYNEKGNIIGLANTMIYVNNIKGYDSLKACFIRWVNDRSFGKDGINKIKEVRFDIGNSTIYLETNIDSSIVKDMFPSVKCKIVQKRYKQIQFVNRSSMQNLDFFNTIKFIE